MLYRGRSQLLGLALENGIKCPEIMITDRQDLLCFVPVHHTFFYVNSKGILIKSFDATIRRFAVAIKVN